MSACLGFAQSPTGTIRGTVLDRSGAVIAKATITITNVQTNETKTTQSDNEGRYILNFVQPAVYTVTATASGFGTEKQDNVVVEVSVGRPVDFTLGVAQLSQKIEVTSTTPPLETSTSAVDTVVTSQQITDLPLNGRNPTSLEVLVPGVSTVGGASTPHIAGSRNANNEEQIDGMTNILPENNVGNNSTAYTPIVDSVEEFNVQTSTLPAQYGRFSGGVISLVTRSGTNQFHGTLFDFTQTNALYAKNYFSSGPVPDSHLYQFGGTVGGPITIPHVYSGRGRSFFFFAFEDSKQSSNSTETDTVPTAAERTGDFSALNTIIYDPNTATVGPDGNYVRNPFPGNVIPVYRQSKVAQAAIQYYPLPNTGGSNAQVNNYVVTGPVTNNYYHFDLRLDHDFGPKWHSFVRFSHINNPNVPFADYTGKSLPASQGYGGPSTSTAYSASFDNAITLSPSLVMDLRAGFSRSAVVRTAFGGTFDLTSLGLPSPYVSTVSAENAIFPNFGLGNGYASLGSAGYVPLLENPSAVDFDPSVVKVLGGHSVTMGGEYRKLFLNFHQFGYPSGQFSTIDNTWTQKVVNNSDGSGNAIATMLLGLADGGQVTSDTSLATASTYDALFIQDDYQARKNLTFNVGLRWDVEVPRTERHNKLDYWDPTLPSPIAAAVSSSACLYCGDLKGQMVFVGTAASKYGRHQAATQWKDFAPRLGFAWSADDKTVVRGGYGIVYQASALQAAGTTGGAGTDGFTSTTGLNFTLNNQQSVYTAFDNPTPTGFNLPQGVNGGAGTFLGEGISDTYFDNVRNPYTIQGNLNIQRSLPLQTVVEVGYIYNRGNFLINGDPGVPYSQVNPSYLSLGQQLLNSVPNPFYGVITTPGSPLAASTVPYDYLLRPFPQYNGVQSYRKPDSGSHYNAITVKVDKRMSHGLSVLVSFTGSKLMDNAASVVSYLGPTSQTYANQYNPKAEFGISSQDISRLFSSGYIYALPFGRGKQFLGHTNGIVNEFVSGWQTNGIVQWDTGTPVVLSAANNQTGLLGLGQRPTEAAGDPNLSHPTLAKWFNTAIFSQPTPFTIGNAPRALPNVRVPGYVDADMSLFKNNFIGPDERYNVQLRVEAFNALNHPVFNGPDAGVNDANFGLINSQSNSPRQLQLAVKFVY
ncbi:TonB-dependent receptor [Silvibacterium bohemicum]|uniref:TonB-dependent receptor n=1 Tax=Silvibacterium bohemicum TaxID=1577686 RepID=UPI0021A6DF1E|nr:TonB-dependent receptor [Silvibacterium bohemicum]